MVSARKYLILHCFWQQSCWVGETLADKVDSRQQYDWYQQSRNLLGLGCCTVWSWSGFGKSLWKFIFMNIIPSLHYKKVSVAVRWNGHFLSTAGMNIVFFIWLNHWWAKYGPQKHLIRPPPRRSFGLNSIWPSSFLSLLSLSLQGNSPCQHKMK